MSKISDKLISIFNKYKLNRVIDLSEIQSAKTRLTSKIDAGIVEISRMEDQDPSHKVYILLQNVLSYFSEEVSVLDVFSEYYEMVEKFDSEFMPSFPPMSPITKSYFSYFCFCDFRFGAHKETVCTIFRDLGLKFEYDELVIKALDNLIYSSMKLYKHLGMKDNFVELMDIITGEKYLCVSTSKYLGNQNKIWFVRLVPNLDAQYDYHIILNTPYKIENKMKQNGYNTSKGTELRKTN